MEKALLHTRWRLEVSLDQEESLCSFLDTLGATAYYREADPPHCFFAYFPPGPEPDQKGLEALSGLKLVTAERFADEDWLSKSREGFGRIEVGTGFLVKPLWDLDPVTDDRTPLVVNPGLAFGTGGHETTRLCIQLLEELAKENKLGGPILDIGAGTGILALTAHLLGGKDITAFDLDPDCGPAMAELIEMNQGVLNGVVPFSHFVGLLGDERAKGPFNGLLANILLETIQELLEGMAAITKPGAWLIASGILAERVDEALVSLVTEGFKPLKVLQEGAWVAILCERSA